MTDMETIRRAIAIGEEELCRPEELEGCAFCRDFMLPALEALKHQLEAGCDQRAPDKLDRSRWKKCRRCSFSERYYQYCPECGRPQTEDAWAELEMRIGGNDETTD